MDIIDQGLALSSQYLSLVIKDIIIYYTFMMEASNPNSLPEKFAKMF